jgi:hypothetical protein
MHMQTLTAISMSVFAASNIATVEAQQGTSGGAVPPRPGVISATPAYSESMVALQRAAQRLRESIQSLAQNPPGPSRDQALSTARRALYETRQAMTKLPAENRVSGMVVSNVPIKRVNPAQNRTFDDSMKELQLAADRLRDSIQAMADQPAGPRRNDAIKQANEALIETQGAMASVTGYSGTGSSASRGSSAQGNVSNRAGSGSVSGGIAAGSDASEVSAKVPTVAGGVGLNARAMLSSEAQSEHNVKLVFSLNTGNYLADVAVKVKDAKGRTVIDGVSDGPWLYAKLPPGSYTATATYNGRTVSQQFTAGRSAQRVAYLRWPASVEQTSVSDDVSPILGTGPQTTR